MSELPFFQDDGTQTLAQLLARRGQFRDDSIVLAIEARLVNRQLGFQSEPEHVVAVVEDLEREIMNGGFAQFFVNSETYIPFAEKYLRLIGCNRAADIVQKAIGLAGQDDTLDELDQAFFAYPDDIAKLLLDYIDKHQSEIQVEPLAKPRSFFQRLFGKRL